jgi:copper homeostasis protein CutC
MAGSGINPVNVVEIAATGISNIHFSAGKPRFKSIHSMGEMMIVDEEKIKNIINQF